MSQQNVEIVRRFFERIEGNLEGWDPARSVGEAMKAGELPDGMQEALGYMKPDAEWNPAFSTETYRGPLELARGWDELLEAAKAYRLELLEVSELSDDRVLAVFGPSLEGRASGIQVGGAVFAVVTLQDGLIARLDEYTDRQDALDAAGLSEQTMSQANVDTVRRAFQAFNERDVDAMLSSWADDVEMHLMGGFADLMGSEFRGHEGIRRWFDEWVESLRVRAEIEAIHDVGDRVVVIATVVGAGGASGAPVTLRGGQVYTFRDGLITRVENYYEASAALEAVGLSA